MKTYRVLSRVFLVMAVILSDVMCAVVAYDYCFLKNGRQLNSAPAWVAFLEAIPFAAGIVMCIGVAYILKRKDKI